MSGWILDEVPRHEKSRESSPEILRELISTNDYDRSPKSHDTTYKFF